MWFLGFEHEHFSNEPPCIITGLLSEPAPSLLTSQQSWDLGTKMYSALFPASSLIIVPLLPGTGSPVDIFQWVQ